MSDSTAPDQCHCVNLSLATREPSTEDMQRPRRNQLYEDLGSSAFDTIGERAGYPWAMPINGNGLACSKNERKTAETSRKPQRQRAI